MSITLLYEEQPPQQAGNSNPRVSVSVMYLYPFLPDVSQSFCVRMTRNSTWRRSCVRKGSLLFTTVDMRRGFSVSRKGYGAMRSPRFKRRTLRCPMWLENRIPCPTIGAKNPVILMGLVVRLSF